MDVKKKGDVKRINFTVKNLKALAAPTDEKQVYYSDNDNHCLRISVGRAGTKAFVFYKKVDGVPRRKEIGRFPDMTIEQARGKVGELLSRIGKGENPFDEGLKAREDLTVQDLFDKYIDGHAKEKSKTWEVMKKDFERNCGAVKARKAVQVSEEDASRLHTNLSEDRGPYTANRTVQLLRAVFNYATKKRVFELRNPFTGVNMAKETARKRVLTDDEVRNLFVALEEADALEEVPEKRYLKDFVMLCLLTGARKSNVLAMRFCDVDKKEQTWTIGAAETKTDEEYVVALGPTELQIIERREKLLEDGFVFPGTGKTGHIVEPKRAWTTVREAAKIEDVTLHDLRRSLGSALANANVNIALVQGALNHKDIKTTMTHYALTNKSAEREAKEAVHDKWLSGGKKKPDKKSDNVVQFKREST
jgi:integrase